MLYGEKKNMVEFYAMPNPFLWNRICLNQMHTGIFNVQRADTPCGVPVSVSESFCPMILKAGLEALEWISMA